MDADSNHEAAMLHMGMLFLLLLLAPAPGPETDFDYLLGDWTFMAEDETYGKYHGVWSAVKLAEGQILDEYRVLGDDTATLYVTTTLRNYNERLARWELVGAEAGSGLQDFGTARRQGDELHIEQRFGVGTEHASLWRIRYYNIKHDSFSWEADRSLDDGRTWVRRYMRIEATRVGPPRSLGALAVPAK